jgi:glutamate-1-semialdehyde 2,1-aminomutase
MFRQSKPTLENQAFRKLSKNPVEIPESRIEELLASEWERFKASTLGSELEYENAKQTLPLGVVSSFQHWDPYPISIVSAKGAWMTDVDGRELLDLSMGFGAMLAGHLNPVVVAETKAALDVGMLFVTPSPISRDAAERLCKRFSIDMVRFANSGTEATMYAVRTAKAYSGKDAIVKVEGGYHGSYDPLTVSAKPSLDKAGPADHPHAVTPDGAETGTVFVVPFNNLEALERTFKAHAAQIACFIVEPVLENLAIILPDEGYLQSVRDLCDQYGIILIFDEVKTGLTAGPHGAAQRIGVQPDLIALAKSIGGGLPLAAFGGKREIMQVVVDNRMAHFGTFNGNPLAMAGVRAMDKLCTPEALASAEALNMQALERISEIIDEYQLPAQTVGFGIKGCITWSIDPVRNYRDYKATDFKVAELSWLWSLNRGIITPPGLDEQWLISLAHGQREIDILVEDFRELAQALRA